jgi:hypothetical protein
MKKLTTEELRKMAELERASFANLKERESLIKEIRNLRGEQKYRNWKQGGRRVKAGMKTTYKSLKGIESYAKRRVAAEDARVMLRDKSRQMAMQRPRKHGKFVKMSRKTKRTAPIQAKSPARMKTRRATRVNNGNGFEGSEFEGGLNFNWGV